MENVARMGQDRNIYKMFGSKMWLERERCSWNIYGYNSQSFEADKTPSKV